MNNLVLQIEVRTDIPLRKSFSSSSKALYKETRYFYRYINS